MSIRAIDDHFHVTGQLSPGHMQDIAGLGYKTVICMRPDNEGFGQPLFADMAKAAAAAGLDIHYIPVIPGRMTPEQGAELKSVLKGADGRILAFCASGGRCEAAYRAVGGK